MPSSASNWRSRQQDLIRDPNNHRRGPRKRRGSALQQSERRTTTTNQNDESILAERFVTMLNDHDPDAVDGFIAVDYINHNVYVSNGREANRAWWSTFFTAFPDIETTMDDLVVAGDRVVGPFTYRGTHDAPLRMCLRPGAPSRCVPSTSGEPRTASS